MSIARDNVGQTLWILAVLLGVMLLNFLGMLTARPICNFVRLGTFQIIGWVFAVMQAGLATEGVIYSLQKLGVIPAPH